MFIYVTIPLNFQVKNHFKFLFFVLLFTHAIAKKITINSNELSYNDKEKKSYATGKAVATMKDSLGNKTLHGNKLILYHSKEQTEKEEDGIIRIDALGKVKFENDKMILTANRCIYKKLNMKIKCSGCVFVEDLKKETFISGDFGVINLDDDTYFVTKDDKNEEQAKALFSLK